jgi:hypothetical protein
MGSCVSSCRMKCFPCCRSSANQSISEDSVSIAVSQRASGLICPNCGRDFSRTYNSRDFPNHVIRCAGRRSSKGVPSKDTPYEAKSIWIREYLTRVRIPWTQESIKVIILRDELLNTSINNLDLFTAEDMHKEFQVTFVGEIAMDAGGLLREWFTLLMKKVFSEEEGLFEPTKSSCVSYMFKTSGKESRLKEFYFLGKVVGKAVFEKTPVYCPLNRIVFKHLVQEKVTIEDISYFDVELYKSLVFMRDNPITDVFFEVFQTPETLTGDKLKQDLKPNGSTIQVTEENKQEYINLLIDFISDTSIKAPLTSFLDGFYFVIPRDIITILTADEAELMICGIPYIDLQEWQDFTEYRGEFSKNNQTIVWFWEVLSEFSQEYLSQLILFVTGTPRLPVEGFGSLKTTRGDPARFTMEPVPYTQGILPRAHTCFNRLDLPHYPSKEGMKQALVYVLDNHAVGFGIE